MDLEQPPKPPYMQALEDDLNLIVDQVSSHDLPNDYMTLGLRATDWILPQIEGGQIMLSNGEVPRLFPIDRVFGTDQTLLGDGGTGKLKSSYRSTPAVVVTTSDAAFVVSSAASQEISKIQIHDVHQAGAITLKRFLAAVIGIEFLYQSDGPESAGRVVLTIPVEASQSACRRWQSGLLTALRQP